MTLFARHLQNPCKSCISLIGTSFPYGMDRSTSICTPFAKSMQIMHFPHWDVFSLRDGPLNFHLHAICKIHANHAFPPLGRLFPTGWTAQLPFARHLQNPCKSCISPIGTSFPYGMDRSTSICTPFAKSMKPARFHCISRLDSAVNGAQI